MRPELGDHLRELPGGHRRIHIVLPVAPLLLFGATHLTILLDLLDLLDHIGLASIVVVHLPLRLRDLLALDAIVVVAHLIQDVSGSHGAAASLRRSLLG